MKNVLLLTCIIFCERYSLYIVIHPEIVKIRAQKIDVKLLTIYRLLLCEGKLVKAWGLGGLFNLHCHKPLLLKRVVTIYKFGTELTESIPLGGHLAPLSAAGDNAL